mmetsp:Transcript_30130/g.48591  ORF Transcript_30130/g.48591 Transcript_30130/m.48591 type:complete len:196 (-) Transcript_30130:73-660(-)
MVYAGGRSSRSRGYGFFGILSSLGINLATAAHLGYYSRPSPCMPDEEPVNLWGLIPRTVCAPRCEYKGGKGECPMDVPEGVKAVPHCFLQDVEAEDATSGFFCGLYCHKHQDCPDGSRCSNEAKHGGVDKDVYELNELAKAGVFPGVCTFKGKEPHKLKNKKKRTIVRIGGTVRKAIETNWHAYRQIMSSKHSEM